ncbi:hypothetical protein [Reichenbachiella sp.]|uniref:hypothetical protein n=1 Tax=Reichenbachiella sp. TaxID=2184521 RepID=UPI003B5B4037
METVTKYMVGTLSPLQDIMQEKLYKLEYLPIRKFHGNDNWRDLDSDRLQDHLSEVISCVVDDYLDFAEMLPDEIRMEVIAFVYYLLMAMSREKIKGESFKVFWLSGWVNGILRVESLLNEKFNDNSKSYV